MALPATLPPPPPLYWVKPPQQARSQKTFERILDAAEEIVASEGLEALTIQDVVRRAKSSVGAFYSRFPDKDALVRTLHDRSAEQAIATADLACDPARWADVPAAEALEQLVSFVVELFQQRRGLILAAAYAVATDSSYTQQRIEIGEILADRLYHLLESKRDEVGHPDLRVGASFAVSILMHTLEQELVLHRSTNETGIAPDTARELTRALNGYLAISESPPQSTPKGRHP